MSIIGDTEPYGQTRAQALGAALMAAYRHGGFININNDLHSETGLCLSDQMTNSLEVQTLVRRAGLSRRQRTVIDLYYRVDLTLEEIAGKLNVDRRTVVRDKHAAIDLMCAILWPEPLHVPVKSM